MDVDLYTDPGCPWAWATYCWLDEVAPRRQLRLRLRPFSLVLRDGTAHLPAQLAEARYEALRVLRVCAAIHDESMRWEFFRAACEPVYAALLRGEPPVIDIAGAMTATGVDGDLLTVADDAHVDEQIKASMAALSTLLPGEDVSSIPALVLHVDQNLCAVRGPLLDPAPTGHKALQLWDAVERLARTPGVYGISRPRPARHSNTRSLAPA